MGALAAAIRSELPGTRVLSLDSSFGGGDDVLSGFFGDVSAQVARACRWLRSHPAIRESEGGEFDAVGFSQGGLFLRALVQRCGSGGVGGGGGEQEDESESENTTGTNNGTSSSSSASSSSPFAPRARTLITLGSPHQGVTAFPSCDPPAAAAVAAAAAASVPADPNLNLGASSLFCRAAEALIRRGAFAAGVRDRVVQAQYFKPDADPEPFDFFATREWETYLRASPFLPKVNCEQEEEEEEEEGKSLPLFRSSPRGGSGLSLASLHRLVLFRFYGDSVVVPRDSAWFSELRRGRVVPLRETPLYSSAGRGDPLGLRELDEGGRLFFKTAPGNHMRFGVEWFVEKVVRPFLGDDGDGEEEDGGRRRRSGEGVEKEREEGGLEVA